MENKEVCNFLLSIEKQYTEAALKYGGDWGGANFYPRVHHDVNKHFFSKGSRSYRVLRMANMGLLRRVKFSPQYTVDVKSRAYRFAELSGVRVPKAVVGVPLDELDFSRFTVTKPVYSNGGKCIYAWKMLDDGGYYDFFKGRKCGNISELKEIMKNDFLRRGIKVDEWIQEELIVGKDGSPKSTHDVKFYAFYGEISAILQVDTWDKKQYAFFDLSGNQIDAGIFPYREGLRAVFNKELIEVAAELSKKIPWPHVRLDFLVSDNDFSFGEFTSNPGSFSEFNDVWDERLGIAFQDGFGRLFEDLLNNKKFEEYEACFGPFVSS